MSKLNSNNVITIAEARNQLKRTKVKVQGIVTCNKEEVFIQDNTAGINLYKKVYGDTFDEGDLIEVTGKIKIYKGLVRIKKYKVKKISSGNSIPLPITTTIQDIINETQNDYASKLIKIKNVKIENLNLPMPLRIIDNKENKLYICNNLNLPNISNGDWVDVTAIVYVNDDHQLYIRSPQDVVKIHSPISFKFIPGNMSSTFNRTPKICAFLEQGKTVLNLSTTKLYIDDKEVMPVINETTINYIPSKDLSYGKHYVKMSVYDTNNNIHKFEWYFLIENKDIKYNFYYGVPHAHTSYSDGKGIPTEAYMHAKNNNLDFLIITDHSGSLVRSKLNKEVPNYEMLKIEADVINQKHNDFLALIGFETKTALWHHCNIINVKDVIGKKTRKKTEKLYDWLCNKDNIVLSINHPSRSCKNLPYLIEFDKFINLIEVGNGSPPREYRRSEESYFKALDNGWHVGAINGQDNHSETWGDADNLTVVISDKLDIDSFINAMKLRRVYSTETRTLKLTVKGNDHWMGSILDLNKGDKLNLQIAAEDESNPITKIQIISNGGNILNEKMFSKTNTAKWDLSFTITEDSSWYVVKVIHSNDKQGISSPIFVQTS